MEPHPRNCAPVRSLPVKRFTVALFLLMALVLSLDCVAQSYTSVEPSSFDPDDGAPGPVTPTLAKTNGRKITAPAIKGQTGFRDVQISDDHTRAGWLALKKNVCCSIPFAIVVFRHDRIERVITEETCLPRWTFRDGGARIAYRAETCHFSSGPWFGLIDVATGKTLAEFGFESAEENGWGTELPDDAPAWVREL
jgi:hypothetical protein